MGNYNNEDLLGLVELYAEQLCYISSEEELSDRFDDEVSLLVVEQYGEDDEVAMSEAFNNWSDSLCKDGEIHPEQYNQYCYVGLYSA